MVCSSHYLRLGSCNKKNPSVKLRNIIFLKKQLFFHFHQNAILINWFCCSHLLLKEPQYSFYLNTPFAPYGLAYFFSVSYIWLDLFWIFLLVNSFFILFRKMMSHNHRLKPGKKLMAAFFFLNPETDRKNKEQ